MEITEVRIFLRDNPATKLRAYATITFDNAFVVRNIKVIEGNKGLFVAMPSRRVEEPCPKCGAKNSLRSKYCNQCGSQLPQKEYSLPVDSSSMSDGEKQDRRSEHRDIAHPINMETREYIQNKILEAYEAEKGKKPEERGFHQDGPASLDHI
ncbi:MAG: septation protein SpoVG family protein [Candidatus Omnitrophica bacterium]|nr:septation protein SpoVG family protein [Candidatus Omnitrophota bacterium]